MYGQHFGKIELVSRGRRVNAVRGAMRTQTSGKVTEPLAPKSHIYLPEVPLETSLWMAEFCCGAGALVPLFPPFPILAALLSGRVPVTTVVTSTSLIVLSG